MSNAVDAGSSDSGTVLIEAGEPIETAAAWIGHACWAELRFHEVLTTWLAVEPDVELSQTLWLIRAHRAELAEAWHRRLPELREFPRPGFVVPSGDVVSTLFDEAEGLVDETAAAHRAALAAAILEGFSAGYRNHLGIAVGPADGPTAESLARAIEVTDADLVRLDPAPSASVPSLP